MRPGRLGVDGGDGMMSGSNGVIRDGKTSLSGVIRDGKTSLVTNPAVAMMLT